MMEENENHEEEKEQENTSLSEKKNEGSKEGKLFKRYKVKDFIFIVVASAAMLVACFDMPLIIMSGSTLFGITLVGIAFQVAFFQAVILSVVRKPGASFLSATLLGLFHVVFAPQMIFFSMVSGLLGEIIGLLIFRGYKSYVAISFTSSLLVPFITIVMILWYLCLLGVDGMKEHLNLNGVAVWIPIGMFIAVLALSVAGAICGSLLMRGLYKKGVLHASE